MLGLPALVAAVLLAHREALRLRTRRPALAGLPLVALMLGHGAQPVDHRPADHDRGDLMMHATLLDLADRFDRLDRRTIGLLRRWSPLALRLALGVVFVWFGALKVLGVTPVAELVARTVYWVDPGWLVPVLGLGEVIIGTGLIVGRGLRLVLALFALQMAGTFLVLVVQPDVAFQRGNPLLLTVEGEFVVKNLVLLAAGMAVGARVEARSRPAAGEEAGG